MYVCTFDTPAFLKGKKNNDFTAQPETGSHGNEQAVFYPIYPTDSVLDFVYLLSLCPNGLAWYKSSEG